VAYGLAVGARPSLLFGAVILLVPVAQAWREPRPEGLPRSTWLSGLLAATGPIVLIGLGLMLYNARRFDSPFEFGQHYQLAGGEQQVTLQNFNLRFLWFNFRVYFLEPARWGTHFPFVQRTVAPPLPLGYTNVEGTYGILTNFPLVWLALAAPLAWRNRPDQTGSILRWFVIAAALLFGIYALTLGLFCGACFRYEVDFLPASMLLAVVGILGLDRALADRPAWRRTVRWVWGLLLSFSVVFNLLASVEHHAEAHRVLGVKLFVAGETPEAIKHYEQALRIYPDYANVRLDLGIALAQIGRTQEAIEQYELALRLDPDYANAHYNLAIALEHSGRVPEAIQHYEQALRTKPGLTEARDALARLQARP
jgi:tetratricopeptide (TPR) repeat protein